MNSDDNNTGRSIRRFKITTILIIVALSTIAGAILGFAGALSEIWFDLASYAPENDNLLAAVKIESSYIRQLTISIAIIGCVAGILGSIMLTAWRMNRRRNTKITATDNAVYEIGEP